MRSPRLAGVAGLAGLAGLVAAALLVATACTQIPRSVVSPSGEATPSESVTPSPTVSPTPPAVDPATTLAVCTEASSATAVTTSIYNEQIASLEQAAARNDQATMVLAAEAINRQFIALADTLTVLSQRAVSQELNTVLVDIATALRQMSSLAYTGTIVDIRKKLLDFAAAFQHTCPPVVSPSPSPSA
jgi:hypothetical protein